MIADVADYSEWKTSRRATGFMYAGILFALKAGLSLGGALSAWIINAYGYVPNVVQTERALLGIRLGASIYPALALLLGLVCLAIYPIGKELGNRSTCPECIPQLQRKELSRDSQSSSVFLGVSRGVASIRAIAVATNGLEGRVQGRVLYRRRHESCSDLWQR
jgi:Na+/melibiose symporter-like transporter